MTEVVSQGDGSLLSVETPADTVVLDDSGSPGVEVLAQDEDTITIVDQPSAQTVTVTETDVDAIEVPLEPETVVVTDDAPAQVVVAEAGVAGPPGSQGPTGAIGATGPQGPQGPVGAHRFYGEGPPTVVIGAAPGDEYVDELTGDLYVLS